jgi:uncharacterized damage-inducible protein DinB
MSKIAVNDLKGQFQHALDIFYEEVGRFTPEEWITGFEFFQVPARQAYHLLECLEFYFLDPPPENHPWGAPFEGGWWELEGEQLPDQEAILAYARKIEAVIMQTLTTLEDEDLLEPLTARRCWGSTLAGHYTYALRHTAHHQGQLAAQASYHGHAGGSWDR